MKKDIQRKHFQKHQLKLYHQKIQKPKTIPSNMVCQRKFFDNDNLLYIV